MNSPSSVNRPWAALVGAPVLLALAVGAFAWWHSESLVLRQTVAESRTVADLAENVGRWASQYGGVHVRTQGADAKIPGNYLTRKVYAATDGDAGVLQGVQNQAAEQERAALQRLEAYHWKNPALIQREVADVIAASGSKARYRLTAATVLNPNNAPNAFEREAMDVLKGGERKEYWKVMGSELHFARAVVAQKSCLTCHASAAKAPEFIRTNQQFNGGGGFGYQEGRPAGVISVAIPLPATAAALAGSIDARTAGALAVALAALGWLGHALWRRSTPARRAAAAPQARNTRPATSADSRLAPDSRLAAASAVSTRAPRAHRPAAAAPVVTRPGELGMR